MSAAADTDLKARMQRCRFLVVDDVEFNRVLLREMLNRHGFSNVEMAKDGGEALEKAQWLHPDLIILDLMMPTMDGFEFVSRTRADPELSRTPAILVSSRDAADDLARGEQAGARAYIVKGEFDQGLLLSTIRELLR